MGKNYFFKKSQISFNENDNLNDLLRCSFSRVKTSPSKQALKAIFSYDKALEVLKTSTLNNVSFLLN